MARLSLLRDTGPLECFSMGHTLWIQVRGCPAETHDDMNVLERLATELDALAERRGVAKLSSFFDYSELERAYDPDGEAICEPCWFDAKIGLAAFTMLRSTLEHEFSALAWTAGPSRSHWPTTVLDELRRCEQALLDAVAKGREFRLLVVP